MYSTAGVGNEYNHVGTESQVQAEKIYQNLGGRQLGNGEWMCHCPSHNDRNPSLHVSLKDDRVLVHCHAGCNQDDVIRALRARGLWPERKQDSKQIGQDIPDIWPTKPQEGQKVAHLTCQWRYYHPIRKFLIGIVGRYEESGRKEVIPFFDRWPDGKWKAGLGKYKNLRPWFGLEKVGRQTEKLVVVQGEKCVSALSNSISRKTVVISWQGGDKAVKKADWEILCLWSSIV
jgi:hypothetical protein